MILNDSGLYELDGVIFFIGDPRITFSLVIFRADILAAAVKV